jgi:hypothetical protein
MVALAEHHHVSRKIGRPQDPLSVNQVDFDTFHEGIYDTQTPIAHWGTTIPGVGTYDLASWKWAIKPRNKDFVPSWSEVHWSQVNQSFLTTVAALGLFHLIDKNHIAKNNKLDKCQQFEWMYMVLQEVMQAPTCRSIVTKHCADKDTRIIWEEICEMMEKSMVTQTVSQSILTFLASTMPTPSEGSNGSQQSLVMHFTARARQYDNISGSPYKPGQLTQLLRDSVREMPNLAQVHTYLGAEKEAKNTVSWTNFEEYLALLLQQVQVYDADNPTHCADSKLY